MTERRGDEELRRRFADLRADDARRAPPFDALMERARREDAAGTTPRAEHRPSLARSGGRGPARRWPLATGALAAAAIAGVLLWPGDDQAEFEAAVASYGAMFGGDRSRSPTDGLLRVPGIEVVRSVPSIGGPFVPGAVPRRERNDNG